MPEETASECEHLQAATLVERQMTTQVLQCKAGCMLARCAAPSTRSIECHWRSGSAQRSSRVRHGTAHNSTRQWIPNNSCSSLNKSQKLTSERTFFAEYSNGFRPCSRMA